MPPKPAGAVDITHMHPEGLAAAPQHHRGGHSRDAYAMPHRPLGVGQHWEWHVMAFPEIPHLVGAATLGHCQELHLALKVRVLHLIKKAVQLPLPSDASRALPKIIFIYSWLINAWDSITLFIIKNNFEKLFD